MNLNSQSLIDRQLFAVCFTTSGLTLYYHIMRFGAHVSIANNLADSVDRATSIGCDAMQIFPGNPRGWKASFFTEDQLADFIFRRRRDDIHPLAIHMPYLVNLGSPVDRVAKASIVTVLETLEKAKSVDADFLVMHTGSHGGAGLEFGMSRLKTGLDEILRADFGSVKLLLENTAGSAHSMGSRLEMLRDIFQSVKFDHRLGLCLDTCHAYAAGYDIANKASLDSFLEKLDKLIGRERLGLIHANDSKNALGSHKDRHEHIGRGEIGLEGFRNILAHPDLSNMTFILETPRPEAGDDAKNLQELRQLAPAGPTKHR